MSYGSLLKSLIDDTCFLFSIPGMYVAQSRVKRSLIIAARFPWTFYTEPFSILPHITCFWSDPLHVTLFSAWLPEKLSTETLSPCHAV